MQVKQKAEWRAIKISGASEAFVAIVDGKEYGFIERPSRQSAWRVYRGIGHANSFLGHSYSKEGAKFILLKIER